MRGLRRLQKNLGLYVLQFAGQRSKRQAPARLRMKES
jgi:hypothetical protein